MFKNYFRIAWRHLYKNRLYAAVNIFGLAAGIASCILIGLYVWNELSFDRFHTNGGRIVRVTWQYNFGNAETKTALTGTKVGPEFTRRFPEVEAYVRTLKFPRVVTYENKMFDEKNFFYADSAFFTTFSFPLLEGDPKSVLQGVDKIVLTQSSAKKYFGNQSPIGKIVKVGGNRDFIVSGIAADVPENSQMQFDFVGTFSSLNAAKTEKWSEANYITYLLLGKGVQFKNLQSKIDNYIKQVGKEEMQLQAGQFSRYHLEPLTAVHLHSDLDGFEPNNNITYIYILAAIAVLILLIACVNYTNLSTAQSAGRSAEIGMRKVMGAGKQQVFGQFIIESYLLVLLSILLGMLVAFFLLPFFNQLSGKNLPYQLLYHPATIGGLVILSVIIAFCAGAYPALVLSGGRIIQVLKSGFSYTSSGTFRKSLIIFQFVISIFLVISTIVILQQLSFIRNKDLGYNKEQILVLPVDRTFSEHYDETKSALLRSKGVISIGGAYEEPTDIGWGDGITTKDGKNITVNALPVDEDAIRTLGMKIVSGSDYTHADVLAFDTSNNGENIRYTFMLNETAVKALGWTPEQAIGKTIEKGREGVVKAVVKDFHFRSFHEAIDPLVIFLDKRMVGALFVRITGNNVQSTIENLGHVWKERITNRPFEYKFLDEDFDALYKTEQRTAQVFTTFSTLAILLACLGLFALTAYSMVRRTKEIGIRKILGATIPDILALVSKDFLKLVLIALILAVPIALYATHQWLQTFVYRINIQWWVFLAAGLLILAISFITISVQALKTASANPVKNLRTE
ncbi:MAG: ABC transporter permease [Flavisolibacter sp.]